MKYYNKPIFFVSLLLLFWGQAQSQIQYPETRRIDHVDVYHGVEVSDPYRWLEDDVRESGDVAEWVAAQNAVTFSYLEGIPERKAIERRLTKLWNYERYSSPFKAGGRYYYYKNDGLQNQSVLYMVKSLNDEPRVLIDPNTWSEDGTIALAGTAFSDDGRFVAYGIAEAGSDWRTWRVMEIESGRLLEDELKWVKFSGISWTGDSRGFYYGRYEEPDEGDQFQGLNLNQRLYFHRVGTDQSEDRLIYERPDQPKWTFGTSVTEDSRYLIISIRQGTDARNRLIYMDISTGDHQPIELIDNFDYEYSFIGNTGPVFYFRNNLDAPRGRLISIDIRKPDQGSWQEIIPQANETLRWVSFVGNRFVASYLKDAKTQIKIFTTDGRFVREVDFPTIGSAWGFGGKQDQNETFYSFSSFATPPSIYRYDMNTGQTALFRQSKVDFEPGDYEVKQIFYRSKDGTRVPMFVVHRKGITMDGNNPTLLYGYGGFDISLTPGFSVTRLAWMEMGGVFAMANLRGGGEYGEKWHKAGTKTSKQNVFDDFIAAAEWLIDNDYTRKERLAIQGGSNGGLLVGAVMTQRPDLFGACLPAVGVMDMLRFHKFTAGRFWVDDYGSSDDPEEFKALHAYSPYHNLKPGISYPPTLVTTADTDDRVVPGHSFKFAAQLQYAHVGANPVLIRIETRAGHGAGKPTSKRIEEIADQWAFLVKNLGMTIPSDYHVIP